MRTCDKEGKMRNLTTYEINKKMTLLFNYSPQVSQSQKIGNEWKGMIEDLVWRWVISICQNEAYQMKKWKKKSNNTSNK